MSGYNFTDGVRRTLQQARDIASAMRHEYVGPEHLLLGILANPDDPVVASIRELDADPALIRQMVEKIAKPGDRPVPTGPELPYTSRAKKALELSMLEARERGDTYVGTEHLLLGLIREEKGIAAQVLTVSGVSLDRARTVLGKNGASAAPAEAPFDAGAARRNALVAREAARHAALDELPRRMRLTLALATIALLVAVIALVRTL